MNVISISFLKLGLLLPLVLGFHFSSAQADTWVRKNDVAYNGQDGPRIGTGAAAFSIGSKGYVIGAGGTLWEYAPLTDNWTLRGNFPGSAGGNVVVTMNGKGYLINMSTPATWEYDPANNSWVQKASFPGQTRSLYAGFVIDNKAYCGTGRVSGSMLKDLWEFDPLSNSWTQKADLPTTRASVFSFAISGKGYFVGGYYLNGGENYYPRTTYEYDPVLNAWTIRAMFPDERWRGVSFTIGSKGYIGMGSSGTSTFNSILEYDPIANTWVYKGTLIGRDQAFAFVIGTKAFMGAGQYYGDNFKTYNDFFEYDPATSSYTLKNYLGGMAMQNCGAFSFGDAGYITAGSRTTELVGQETWKYSAVTDIWLKRPNVNLNREGSIIFTIDDVAYKFGGSRYVIGAGIAHSWEGSKYNATTEAWSFMTTLSGQQRSQGVGFSVNGKGYMGLGTNGNKLNTIWQYDPVGPTWTQMSNFPGQARQEAVSFQIGERVFVGTGSGTTLLNDMWEYNATLDTWTQRANFGGTARKGAVAFAINGKGYIATGDDGVKRKDLWEYDPINDTWTQRADLGGAPRSNAMAFVVGAKAYVGTGALTSSTYAYDLWEYTPLQQNNNVLVDLNVFLDGPYNSANGLMKDDLRSLGLVPLNEPYSGLGYAHAGGGGELTVPSVLSVSGNNAIVDWIVVELRSNTNSAQVIASTSALLQRDGDVVSVDGISPVTLAVPIGSYFVSVHHRNHLGVMTSQAIALSAVQTTIDLTLPSTLTFGTEARRSSGAVSLLWAGDCTRDAQIKYTGTGNDRDMILTAIGGVVPTNMINNTYSVNDINMDGRVAYTGTGNDRDRILQSIGGVVPTFVRAAQLP